MEIVCHHFTSLGTLLCNVGRVRPQLFLSLGNGIHTFTTVWAELCAIFLKLCSVVAFVLVLALNFNTAMNVEFRIKLFALFFFELSNYSFVFLVIYVHVLLILVHSLQHLLVLMVHTTCASF